MANVVSGLRGRLSGLVEIDLADVDLIEIENDRPTLVDVTSHNDTEQHFVAGLRRPSVRIKGASVQRIADAIASGLDRAERGEAPPPDVETAVLMREAVRALVVRP